MLKIGLTGGIASGKTVVEKMFADLGAYVIRADDIAHDLMKPGEAVHQEIVRRFGNDILNADGTVNRPKLAKAAFGSGSSTSATRIEELNQIVHPPVIQKQEAWMEEVGRRDPKAIAIVEAALILEANLADHFDKLVVVTCRAEQRAERWANSRKIAIEHARLEIARRLAAQWPDEVKIEAADYVIDNSGSLAETELEVKEIYQTLRRIVDHQTQSC
ncbi:MAG TPA: dephospho-CoA kinase [Terriglobales bacterium]|nr:dephospho-CoA kinase [Terriglobales bacterium]